MIRGTRHKQSRLSPRRRKTASSRRIARARSTSQNDVVQRVKTRKASPAVVQNVQDLEREVALKNFGIAIRYFQKRDYQRASELFEKVATGPVCEMADRARVHLSFCERQRRQEKQHPKTAEGCYASGVAALNSRDFDQALEYLTKSDKLVPGQEYVHYALAAAYGLQGDPDNALSHLEEAIRLRPQNRVQARHDEDFQTLSADPRFSRLLGADARQSLRQGA
jgi:tetratricopeptide (TPR) repeat protein